MLARMVLPLIPIAFVIVGALVWVLLDGRSPKLAETGRWMLIVGLLAIALANTGGRTLAVHV